MIRDLKHWETLLTSSMMQRPVNILHGCDIVNDIKNNNLRSALAYAALITPSGSDESQLYENIVEIP